MNARRSRLLLGLTAATCVIAVGLGAVLLSASKGSLTFVRNSLLSAPSTQHGFDWTPGDAPSDFMLETLPPPPAIASAAAAALVRRPPTTNNGLDAAIAIARHLGTNTRQGGAIRRNTLTTLERIREKGRGYCADYSQVFMALALAADIPVREWGFGEDGFGAGHAFNEIYDTDYGKWIFIDPFQAFYVVDAQSGTPLSVVEFLQRLRQGVDAANVTVVRTADEQFRFRSPRDALAYYAKATDYFYLFWGNNVFTYDANPWVAAAAQVSRVLEIVTAILVGVQPHIVPVPTETNPSAIRGLALARVLVLALLCAIGALGLLVALQLRARAQNRHVAALY